MKRRTFLGMLGAATATGVAGVAARPFPRHERSEEPEFPLDDAAGPPDGARLGTRQLVWSVDTDEPVVAFTFDDGPDPDLTPRVLEVLDEFGVPATFFAMGHNVAEHPELLLQVVGRGHEIANHTWTHVDLSRATPEETHRQLTLGRDAIERIANVTPRFFRPPRGRLTGTAARYAAELSYDVTLWSVGRGVPGVGTPDAITEHMLGSVRQGDIVLLHDGIGRETFQDHPDGPGPVRRRREVEMRALRNIVEGTLERGLRPVTMSDLLDAAKPQRTA